MAEQGDPAKREAEYEQNLQLARIFTPLSMRQRDDAAKRQTIEGQPLAALRFARSARVSHFGLAIYAQFERQLPRSNWYGVTMSGDSASHLSPKCRVVEQRRKGGYGIVAAQPISKGEIVCIWGGRIVDGKTLASMEPKWREHSIQVAATFFVANLNTVPKLGKVTGVLID